MSFDDSFGTDTAVELANALAPGSGPLLKRLITAARGEWSRSRREAFKAAQESSGLSPGDFLQQVTENPELIPLATRLLWQATLTGQQGRLEALGAVFGLALDHPAQLDEVEVILETLPSVRPHDIRVLRGLRTRQVIDLPPADTEAEDLARDGLTDATEVGQLLGYAADEVVYGLNRLTSAGFAKRLNTYGDDVYVVTDLGELLCEALDRLTS